MPQISEQAAVKELEPYRHKNHYESRSARGPYAPVALTGRDQVEQAIDLFYRGRWVILLTLVVVFAAAAAYTFTRTPTYEAESFVLLSGGGRSGSDESRPYLPPSAFSGEVRSLANELTLLENSRALPRAVARRLIEMQTIPRTGAVISILRAEDGALLTRGQVARRLREYVVFTPAVAQGASTLDRQENNAIQVTASRPSPHEAALLANLFAREYVVLTRKASRASLTASREFLEEQLKARKDTLQAIEEDLTNYLNRKDAAALDQESRHLVSRIAQMETRRDAALVALKTHQASQQALDQRLKQVSPMLVRRIASNVEQDIAFLHAEIAELKATRAEALLHNPGLKQQENPPQLREIDRQIQQLQAKVDDLSQQYVNAAIAAPLSGQPADAGGMSNVEDLVLQIADDRLAIIGLRTEVAALNEQLEGYEAELATLPKRSMGLAKLRRSQEIAQGTYKFVLQQLQETHLKEQAELGYATLIAEASVPLRPVSPDTRRNLILGAFFGLLLGMGIAVVRYKLDNRVHKPDQLLARGHNATVIPNMQPLIKEEYRGQTFIEQDGQRVATSLVALHNPMSFATEAYRQLRTNIQFGLPSTAGGTLLVTSAGAEEGKSTTSANLALIFARAGRRTLLIDADLRQPHVHRILGLQREQGLIQLLRDGVSFEVEDLRTQIDDLYAVTAGGTADGDAAELIGSDRMHKLLSTWQDQFDVIVIDTPPVLLVTEARLLALQCDATILVARAGRTKEKELDHAVGELQRVGAKVTGVVLNGFDLSMAYGYKYRYRHYSANGYYGRYAN